MEEYQNRDRRFKIISLSKNQGVSIARNKGIDSSTGKYIGFVDSDDYVDLNYFEVLSSSLEQSKIKIAISSSVLIEHQPKDIIDFNNSKVHITEGGASACMRLFDRELIGEDRFIEHCRFEDSAFTFLMHMKSGRLIIADDAEYYYCSDNEYSFSKCNRYTLQSILDGMKVMDYLQTKVTKNPAFSIFQEKVNNLDLEFLFDNAEYLMFSTIEKEKGIELISHLDALIDKKYRNIRDNVVNYGSLMIDKYTKDCYKERYLEMNAKECEDYFKCKVKTLMKEENHKKTQ